MFLMLKAGRTFSTGITSLLVFAMNILGESSCRAMFSHPGYTGKEHGMGYLPGIDQIL